MKSTFEMFFDLNQKIKINLFNLAPNSIDVSTELGLIEYSNKLYKSIDVFSYYFYKLNYYTEIIDYDTLHGFFENMKSEFLKMNITDESITNYFQRCFSNMDPLLADEVSKSFEGYSLDVVDTKKLVSKCGTINELLHLYHSFIINNEKFFSEVPEIQKYINDEGFYVTLRGNSCVLGENLFNQLQKLPLGITDICVLGDKIIIMVRDIGHALCIEIEKENDMYYVKYHIPKTGNLMMINSLKGINKIDNPNNAALGKFATDEENLISDITNLIKGIPDDFQMDFKNEENYSR